MQGIPRWAAGRAAGDAGLRYWQCTGLLGLPGEVKLVIQVFLALWMNLGRGVNELVPHCEQWGMKLMT